MFMELTNISPRISGQRRDTALPPQSANNATSTNNADESNDTISGFDGLIASITDKNSNDLNDAGQSEGSDANNVLEPDGADNRQDAISSLGNEGTGNINAQASGWPIWFVGENPNGKSLTKSTSEYISSPPNTGELADIINHIENSSHNSGKDVASTNQKSNGLSEYFIENAVNVSKNQLQDEAINNESNLRNTSKHLTKENAADGQIGNLNSNSENTLRSSAESISGQKAIDGIIKALNAGIEITTSDGKARANINSIKNVVEALQQLPSASKFMKIAAAGNETGLPADDDKMIELRIIEKLNYVAAGPDRDDTSGRPVLEGKQVVTRDSLASNLKSRGNDNIIKLAESDKDNGDEKSNPDLLNEKNENSLNNKSASQGEFIKAINSTIKSKFAVPRTSGGSEPAVPERVVNIRLSEFAGKAMQLARNAPPGGKVSARMVLRPASLGTVFVNVSLNGNIASLDIKVDRPEILKQLESQLSVLRDKLGQNGIKTEQLEIRLKGQDSANSYLAGQFEHFQGQNRQRQDRQEFLRSYQYLAKAHGNLALQVNYDEQGSLVESNN